jgi:hypothetical protein
MIFSGEGSTDTGTKEYPGPMIYLVDQILIKKFSFSIIDQECFTVISRKQLGDHVKTFRPLPKERAIEQVVLQRKKRKKETGTFYANARALGILAKEFSQKHDVVCAVFFQDADSIEQQEWQKKWDSVIDGFSDANFTNGVPMIPKPISEAWILCAIYRAKNPVQNCDGLENTKHGNQSEHALKIELENELNEQPTRELLNEKIMNQEINIQLINLPSFNQFKEILDSRLQTVDLGYKKILQSTI